ncbi:MAG: DoxX family protein [Clostridium sp.]|nr:DoxX family protein [Clostridium sp.]
MFFKLLFPQTPSGWKGSLVMLVARVSFGLLLLWHGLAKWNNFQELSLVFPDPLGIGSDWSVILAIFAEVICAVACVAGLFFRLALLPMIFTMGMAYFVIHAGDPFAAKELPLAYMIAFILMWVAGPGRLSLDALMGRQCGKAKRT